MRCVTPLTKLFSGADGLEIFSGLQLWRVSFVMCSMPHVATQWEFQDDDCEWHTFNEAQVWISSSSSSSSSSLSLRSWNPKKRLSSVAFACTTRTFLDTGPPSGKSLFVCCHVCPVAFAAMRMLHSRHPFIARLAASQ